MSRAIGHRRWVIPEGYLPGGSADAARELASHETACVLNTSDQDARLEITLYFAERDPVGPYRVTVPARRTAHLRFDDLKDPQLVPRATDYSSVIESDVPVVVQHTRLDSRRAEIALMSTVAFPGD